MPTVPKRKIAEHGTLARYRAGCRCGPCRGANAESMRAYVAHRRAEGRPLRGRAGADGSGGSGLLADQLAIAGVAEAADGTRAIAARLVAAGAVSSSGPWHAVKVHRRIERMRREMPLVDARGLRAGAIARIWVRVRETVAARGGLR